MAWPTSFNISTLSVGKNGLLPSLVAFGTDGMITSVIVRDIRATPMITEITEEQGSGLTATQILLSDGNEIEITVTDDRAVSWPQPGTPLVLINPQPNGVNGTTETFQTINNNYTVARKVTGQRVLHCKHYVLIVPVQM